ncbi:hypothetical protein HNY73_006456 [Argiope bruennichi]|uniref:DNA-directed DNA polymerase n=1 Tax=Argiope bruennichi TaxID=94029 RepID=A0A8T0FML6_ARGBR|nr:hypothetical protein HNY73_006456 [Argiope bruennichi]
MALLKNLKKDELVLVAEELGLELPVNPKILDLRRIIESSDVFKTDKEFIQSVINYVLEEKKSKKDNEKSKIEQEKLKLEQEKLKLEFEKVKLEQLNKELELTNAKNTILLAEVFQSFRQTSMMHYHLDPAHFLTIADLTWHSGLKFTGQELKLLSNVEDYVLLETQMRGGICFLGQRYAQANNPYLSCYNPDEPTNYIVNLDVNNLYGHCMSEYLPVGDFRWLSPEEIAVFDLANVSRYSETGYLLEGPHGSARHMYRFNYHHAFQHLVFDLPIFIAVARLLIPVEDKASICPLSRSVNFLPFAIFTKITNTSKKRMTNMKIAALSQASSCNASAHLKEKYSDYSVAEFRVNSIDGNKKPDMASGPRIHNVTYPDIHQTVQKCILASGQESWNTQIHTAQDAYQLTSSAIDILRSAGFNLRKLRTNCGELNKLWFENGYKENTDHGQGSGFLGLNWYPIEDEIKLNLKDVRNSLEFGITNGTSKRHVLRVISQIFDPCGLISPFVITVKILIQELWKRGLEWDEQLPQDLEEKCNTLCSELSAIDNLRNEQEGTAKVSFIISKSKAAPLKTLTLARLELMAALVGARLAKYLQDTFPSLIKRVYLWNDSKIVIHWVKGSAKIWKPFVCNRVTQVQLLTSPLCWNHCSGSENPADLTTRGESAKAFLSSSLWWTGPEWLSRPVQSWPVQCSSILSDSICDEEIFSSERRRTETVNTMVATTNVDDCISSCINIDKYSNLRKLLRVTAFVKRFMINSKPGSLKFSGPLSAFELQEALHS